MADKIECNHEWQHFKFVENPTSRFKVSSPFALAYYCRKCLDVCVRRYAPLVPKKDEKQEVKKISKQINPISEQLK